jgi:hypothetical protein
MPEGVRSVAFVHGKNAHFEVEDSGAVSRVLSQYLDSISGLPGAVDLSEVTAFGDDGTMHIPGLENVTFSISGHYDPTETTGPHAVLSSLRSGAGGPYAFSYGPGGNASGAVEMAGDCWMTGYTVDAAVADKVSFSAEFQVNGTVTLGAFS